MRNIKLTIRFDGTKYSGWQSQKNGRAIQDVLQDAVEKVTGRRANVIGSGRTDAGVHAEALTANFKTASKIPLKKVQMALNSNIPRDIAITHVEEVPHKFNAQKSAKSKLYRYTIVNNDYMDPFLRYFAAKCFYSLDIGLMRKAAEDLVGCHDFRSFQTKDPAHGTAGGASGEEKNSVRTIKRLAIEKSGNIVYIYMEADGFLYNMARNIAGTLIEVGRKKFGASCIKELIRKKDRRFSGPTMPAKGLCLVRVRY